MTLVKGIFNRSKTTIECASAFIPRTMCTLISVPKDKDDVDDEDNNKDDVDGEDNNDKNDVDGEDNNDNNIQYRNNVSD